MSIYSPKISGKQLEYENKYQQVYRVQADFGDFSKEYFVIETGHRAGVVVDVQGSILLVRQYRLLIDGLSWEIPGGRVDEGEAPMVAASRECLEETGVQCLGLSSLIFYQKGMDTSHNPTHLFYCDRVEDTSPERPVTPQEVVEWEWVPLNQTIKMIFSGEIVDSFTIIALLAYQNRLVEQAAA